MVEFTLNGWIFLNGWFYFKWLNLLQNVWLKYDFTLNGWIYWITGWVYFKLCLGEVAPWHTSSHAFPVFWALYLFLFENLFLESIFWFLLNFVPPYRN